MSEESSRFEKIYIEISNICNLQCSFCPQDEIQNKKTMELELFSRIIDEVKPFTNDVTFHILGEPLLHKNLEQYLAICEANHINVHITTNGLLKDKFYILRDSRAIKQINFSLHSFYANTNTGKLEDYLNPILDFCTHYEDKSPYINLRLWDKDNKESYGNIEMIQKIEARFDVSLSLFIARGDRKSKKIKDKIYLNLDTKFEFPNIESEILSTSGSCYGLKSHIAINAEGFVIPCCLDYSSTIKLGDLKKDSLKDILYSKRAIDILEGFTNNKLIEPLCQRCSYIRRFVK